MPSAPPSTGSVPAPTSSSSTSAGSASVAIHGNDVRDVRREGAQARRDRLLVADVGKERLEDRHARACVDRNVQARLRHCGEQARGLEGDRLAAGVRAGDEEDARRWSQEDVDRDGIRELGSPGFGSGSGVVESESASRIFEPLGNAPHQQRMPGAAQLERAVAATIGSTAPVISEKRARA